MIPGVEATTGALGHGLAGDEIRATQVRHDRPSISPPEP